MENLFSGMALGEDVYPAQAMGEVGDILKKVGLISVGSIGGGLLRDTALTRVIRNPTMASLAQAGIGVVGAAFALNARSDLLFWPLVGMSAQGVTDLLRQVLGTAGITPPTR